MQPAIVISAYNRPWALSRLLTSLKRSDYPAGVQIPLVISVDASEGQAGREVQKEAEQFRWDHGPKEVVLHDQHLGMLENFFYCAGLSQEYDSIIFLEDDVTVSPVFYHYTAQALKHAAEDARIGGISLYTYAFNGYTHYPFTPLADGADNFYMQIPSILGQAWTSAQWRRFSEWRANTANPTTIQEDMLHPLWMEFDQEEYFPILTSYLVETDRYYLFPRISHTTGFGDAGMHFASATSYFQVPLQRGQKMYRFHSLDDSCAVYDSFHEILPDRLNRLTDTLHGFEFDVDLNATKSLRHLRTKYVLTSRACRDPLLSFAQAMRPLAANVIENIPGSGISLCRKDNLRWNWLAKMRTQKRNHTYYLYKRPLSKGLRLQFTLLGIIEWAQRKINL